MAALFSAYDAVGNRLTRTVTGSAYASTTLPDGTTAYAYDHDDRMTGTTEGGSPQNAYAYDHNGNQLTVYGPVPSGQLASYDWQNKLTSLGTSSNPTANAAYLYDADGDRMGVATSSGTTTDIWDTSLGFPSVVAEYKTGQC